MIILKKAADLQQFLLKYKTEKSQIGFTPTMGALHAGHLSLLNYSKAENDVSVCSIFVNPTQFNDQKDYEKYPVTIEADIYQLEQAGCDLLFLPPLAEIYPHGLDERKHYDLGDLETILEGKYRPGHFQGVCAVVEKLLRIVSPTTLYLGQKDYQQCKIIKRLISQVLPNKIELRICPIIREPDGLAMSSRNMRLNSEERKTAITISRALELIKANINKESPGRLKEKANDLLVAKGFKVDYVEIADADTLEPIANWKPNSKTVALVAAFLNDVRLIDNMVLNE
jgi:pantoate--beta-alanine ligase